MIYLLCYANPMKNSTLYAVAFGTYVVFFAVLVLLILLCRGDEGIMTAGLYAISTGLLLATVVFAVVFLKRPQSERPEEKDVKEQDENWERRNRVGP